MLPWDASIPLPSRVPTLVRPREALEPAPASVLVPLEDPLVGMMLGDYQLQRCIGAGGMGLVYEGLQPLIGKRVAVKVLRPELANDAEQVARLLAEARAVNAIRHRGIIDIFGFGQLNDGRQYIVMEYLDGKALDLRLAEAGRLPLDEALDVVDEVLAALGAAHGAGVVHRDLKPSNVFLVQQPDGSRYVKLLDFGLAKRGEAPRGMTPQTRMDMVVGTPEYMAPEQARGQSVGPMTDLYALGVLTFELVTGQLPFTGASAVDLLLQHVDAPPPRPSSRVPELPPALDEFVLQMLMKDPQRRPASAHVLREQLQRVRSSPPAAAPTSEASAVTATIEALPPPPRPRRRALTLGAAALLAACALAVGLARSGSPGPLPAGWTEPPAPGPSSPGSEVAQRQASPVQPGASSPTAVASPPAQAPSPSLVESSTPVQAPSPSLVEASAPAQRAAPRAPAARGSSSSSGAASQPPPARAAAAAARTPTQQPARATAAVLQPPSQLPAPAPLVRARREADAGPSFAALLARVEGLERDLASRAASGQALSPAAGTTLARLRREVELAQDPAARQQLAGKLGDWERLFLERH